MSLPFLPGYSALRDPVGPRTNFARSHGLAFRNGVPVYDDEKPGIGGTVLAQQTSPKKQDTIRIPPEYKEKSLKFDSYFEEYIPHSKESTRIRRCIIYLHLEDGTVVVKEPKIANSGIPQGVIVKRGKVPKGDDDFLTIRDFWIGKQVVIFGKQITIVDADIDTKLILEELGLQEQVATPPLPVPEDSFLASKSKESTLKETKAVPRQPDPLKKFLDNDRVVLRFFIYWDDPVGDLRLFKLHIFLADDTIEVVEQLQANSGRDGAGKGSLTFMKRQRPPEDFAGIAGLRLGGTIEIYKRQFVIYDCDDFSKQFYKEQYGVTEFTPVKPPVRPDPIAEQRAAARAATASGERTSLVPKAPKKNFQKMLDNDRKLLRYSAKMISNKEEDKDRVFIISFYLADDTVSIYEPPQRNTGFVGGKFLERRKIEKPNSKECYQESDFYVGAKIQIFSNKFELQNADDYAFNHMEANTQMYPSSDLSAIEKKLQEMLLKDSGKDVKRLFARMDVDGSGTIDAVEFKNAMKNVGFNLNDQELVTIMRRYDLDGDGSINYAELAAALTPK